MSLLEGITEEELIGHIEDLAPMAATRVDLSRQIENRVGLGWSDTKWRSVWKHSPRLSARAARALSTALRQPEQREIVINGDVKGAIVSDIHAPFHVKEAIDLTAKVLRYWEPDILVYNGDNLDCTMLSDFDRNPARNTSLKEEADIFHADVRAVLRHALPKGAREVFLPGNHEDRIRRQIWRNPYLYNLPGLSLPELLDVNKKNFAEHRIRFGKILEVSHGTKVNAQPGYSASAELKKRRYSISTATGHVHRSAQVKVLTERGWVIGQEVPCLCTLDPDWMNNPEWSNGIVLFVVKGNKLWMSSADYTHDWSTFVAGKWISL